jgi:hypothetical protein
MVDSEAAWGVFVSLIWPRPEAVGGVQLFLSLVEPLIQLKWPFLSEVAKFIEGDPSVAIEVDSLEYLSDLVLTDLRVHHILKDSIDGTGATLFLKQIGILTNVHELLKEEVIYLARLWWYNGIEHALNEIFRQCSDTKALNKDLEFLMIFKREGVNVATLEFVLKLEKCTNLQVILFE